jgi:predicted molibdopterin-dependent oxidoreductase YjgC
MGEAHDDLRVGSEDPRGLTRGPAVRLRFDGQDVAAYEGESIAAALLAADRRTTRLTRHAAAPRGLFCAIGACHDCLVRVDGSGPVRSCLTPVRDGMDVTTHLLGEGGPS